MRKGKSKKASKRRRQLYYMDDPNIHELMWLDHLEETDIQREGNVFTDTAPFVPSDEAEEMPPEASLETLGEVIQKDEDPEAEPILISSFKEADEDEEIIRVASLTPIDPQ